MTTTVETTNTQETTTNRLRKPLYAVVGVGEFAYHRLQELPARVEGLRERIPSRVRTLREGLPGRVEALRTEVDERVNTLVTGAREVYGGLVAHGEKLVTSARTRRTGGGKAIRTAGAVGGRVAATAPAKAVRKAVKKAVKKTATPRSPKAPKA